MSCEKHFLVTGGESFELYELYGTLIAWVSISRFWGLSWIIQGEAKCGQRNRREVHTFLTNTHKSYISRSPCPFCSSSSPRLAPTHRKRSLSPSYHSFIQPSVSSHSFSLSSRDFGFTYIAIAPCRPIRAEQPIPHVDGEAKVDQRHTMMLHVEFTHCKTIPGL